MQPKREAVAEDAFLRWLKAQPGRPPARKMNGLGFRDWPDRMVLKPKVRAPLWIEFKRAGQGLTRSQGLLHKRLTKLSQKVVVCYTVEQARFEYLAHHD